MVDEFDQVVSNSMFCLEVDELEKIIKIRDTILQIVKYKADDILFSLLTGVSDVTSITGSLVNNNERYPFVSNDQFVQFYGLMEEEFEYLVENNKVGNDFCSEMKKMYNGYEWKGKKLYNTWCVTQAIHQGAARDFFSPNSLIKGIIPVIREKRMDNYMKQILSEIPILCADSLKSCMVVNDLVAIGSYCKRECEPTSNITIDSSIVFQILQQLGYLSYVPSKGLIVPNLSILNTLKSLYTSCFCDKWCMIDVTVLQECAASFPSFNEFHDKFDTQIIEFCDCFKQTLKFKTKTPLNHQILHSLIFAILLYTNQKWRVVGFECPISETGHSNRCDTVLHIGKFVIVIEIKYNESISAAMKQIKDRSYADVIQNKSIFENCENITYIIHFGIAVSNNKETKMAMKMFEDQKYVKSFST